MKQYRTCQEGFSNAISHSVFYAYRQRTVAFITAAAFYSAFRRNSFVPPHLLNSSTLCCTLMYAFVKNSTIYSNPPKRLCMHRQYFPFSFASLRIYHTSLVFFPDKNKSEARLGGRRRTVSPRMRIVGQKRRTFHFASEKHVFR